MSQLRSRAPCVSLADAVAVSAAVQQGAGRAAGRHADVTLQQRPGADRQPGEAHLQVPGRRRTRRSTGTTGCSSTSSIPTGSSCGPTTTCRRCRRRSGSRARRSSTRGRSSSRTIPYIGEASVRLGPLHRSRPASGWSLTAPEASRREYIGRQVRAAAAVREHLPDLQGRLAPGGGRRREPDVEWQWTQEDGDALVPEPEEGRDVLSRVRRPDRPVHAAAAGRRSRSGTAGRTRSRPTSKRKLAHVPDHRRPARHRRHGGAGPRGRQDLQAGRRRSARARHPGLPRVRRAEVGGAIHAQPGTRLRAEARL